MIAAASFAERNNHDSSAAHWRAKAEELQQSWIDAFKPPESLNSRTYICGLWPTWIATFNKDQFYQGLLKRWTDLRDTKGNFRDKRLWTYFDIAEAHQWLFLGQPDRVWSTLNWFWNNQASPGLYSWWEGNGETNTYHRWENVRGWIKPRHVTPHYWTAAEMLLLQLDMLAYITEGTEDSVVVIGAGIPKSWIQHTMSVSGLALPEGKVAWHWDGKQMKVEIHGSKVNVQLGPSFPSDTPLDLQFVAPPKMSER